jgi:4-aminobutyrate aminotransferase/(S)-3-amino-2-methylpropionate transaminase
MKEKYEIIGDVRGLGPMLAMEFVSDKKSKTPNPDASSKVMKTCLSSGLMILKAGLYNNCIRLHPPLTIEDDILNTGMEILEKAVKKAS